ncbi:MAG: hypothetical protein K1000chlam4_00218 [Chlamydiae bacterium]|nr:hypothetical protein [Chlamydiota bacterium]
MFSSSLPRSSSAWPTFTADRPFIRRFVPHVTTLIVVGILASALANYLGWISAQQAKTQNVLFGKVVRLAGVLFLLFVVYRILKTKQKGDTHTFSRNSTPRQTGVKALEGTSMRKLWGVDDESGEAKRKQQEAEEFKRAIDTWLGNNTNCKK